jgi:Plasmid pRiA4b ORF-3-like protein
MAQTPVAEPPGSIYRLRVVLAGISPMIWRQVEVPDSITIAGLHEVLQVAFGWSGEHLHRFTVHGKEYGICYEGGMIFDDDPYQVRLVDLGLRERERFAYAYGFFANLECWRHDLRIGLSLTKLSGAANAAVTAGQSLDLLRCSALSGVPKRCVDGALTRRYTIDCGS